MDWWPAYLALGAFVGFLAGLFGLGGGLQMVPVLVMIFAAQGFPADYLMHLALGTAMATIIFTSVSSVWSHHKRGAVNWRVLRGFLPGILAGTLAGALAAGFVKTRPLSFFFVAFVYFAAWQLISGRKPRPEKTLPGPRGLAIAGGVIGALSSLAAIGGAVLSVPYMVRCNVRMHEAVGTAASIGFPIAIAGTAGYLISGWGRELPPGSVGFIYLPAALFIVAASVLTAPLGARAAHKLSGTTLKRAFAIILAALATKMLWDLLQF